ncbi:MAG: D-alanine--D-alanine ligase [Oscillospiraceae bacterium]|jgi:D-alanine-D-alanine ligase|nr:D-alanine--D-alanine ligase [Oscillospiraceae bacterium]
MNIVVLCGGLSSERDVSLTGGTLIARALRERGHAVALVDSFLGYSRPFEQPLEAFTSEQIDEPYSVPETEPDLEALKAARAPGNFGVLGANVIELCRAADITFLALHGEDGENGRIQATLDVFGVKYTGSGYLGSALAMNKELSKKLLAAYGIGTPMGITLYKSADSYENIGFPCVVKPCSGGSSVGTSIVRNPDDYLPALELAFKYEDAVLVEKYIAGRELTCGVMDGVAMPIIEIIPREGFYDYKNKYQAGLTEEICPANITEDEAKRVSLVSEAAYRALMLEAYCRVDLLMDAAGRLYCLEANTLPGMTPTSLVPQMAAAQGRGYSELCEDIIAVSLKKYNKY